VLVFAYDGSLNGDWVAHYAARFAANTRERRLRLVHVHDGSPPPHLPERIGRIAEECRLLGVALEPELHARGGARVAERLIDLVPLGHETTLICGARAHMRNLAFLAGTVSARLLGAGRFRVVALRVVHPGVLGQPGRVLLPLAGHPRGAGDPGPGRQAPGAPDLPRRLGPHAARADRAGRPHRAHPPRRARGRRRVPGRGVMDRQIHNLEVDEVLSLLRSRAEGLSPDEVAERLAELGPNALTAPPRWVWLRMLAKQFVNLFSLLLDVSAGLCFVADRMAPGEGMAVLGWALAGVALLNALFTFAQAMRAERAMDALREMLPRQITVRRAGAEQEVLTGELVPGDVLLLSEGDRVPADARLIESRDLLANNAPLTGESRSVSLRAERVAAGGLVDSPNLVFAGCSLLRGSGAAVVYATGRRTEFGKVAALSVEVRRPPTPLEREVTRTVRILAVVAVVMGLAFFTYGLATGRPLWVNVVFMLGISAAICSRPSPSARSRPTARP